MTPEELQIQSLEADLVLARQDVKGCVDVFDALGIPERLPNGDLLRPTGRAKELLTIYRRLYVTAQAVSAAYDLGDLHAASDGEYVILRHIFGDRLDRLVEAIQSIPEPEAP